MTSGTGRTKARRVATLSRVAAVSTVAALGAGGVLAASGGAQGAPAPATTKLEFVLKDRAFKFVDHAPRNRGGAGAGDQIMASRPIFTKAGARRGTLDATCTFTRGGRQGRGVCHGTYALTEGDLHLMARVSGDEDVSGSVVGGTRAYVGARGTFASIERPGRSGDTDDTVTLLP